MNSVSFETTDAPTATVSIRRLTVDDDAAVKRLAQLDSNGLPEGRLLGAEVEGRLLAAISLDGGEPIADPFSRTAELRSLLELRAAQLRRREHGRPRRPVRVSRSRARLALAGSPPGTARWLLAQRVRPY
jgi:hypothetical protein